MVYIDWLSHSVTVSKYASPQYSLSISYALYLLAKYTRGVNVTNVKCILVNIERTEQIINPMAEDIKHDKHFCNMRKYTLLGEYTIHYQLIYYNTLLITCVLQLYN